MRVEFWTYDLLLAKLGSNMQIFGLFCCQTAVFTYVSLFNNELVRSSRKRRTLPSPLFNRFWQVKPMTQYCLIRSPQQHARRPGAGLSRLSEIAKAIHGLEEGCRCCLSDYHVLELFLTAGKICWPPLLVDVGIAAFEGILEEKYLMLPLLRPYYLPTFTR